jgi:hypothetical protein
MPQGLLEAGEPGVQFGQSILQQLPVARITCRFKTLQYALAGQLPLLPEPMLRLLIRRQAELLPVLEGGLGLLFLDGFALPTSRHKPSIAGVPFGLAGLG